jgi:radical SAM protein with 4Fe4S-binding SPASM domain
VTPFASFGGPLCPVRNGSSPLYRLCSERGAFCGLAISAGCYPLQFGLSGDSPNDGCQGSRRGFGGADWRLDTPGHALTSGASNHDFITKLRLAGQNVVCLTMFFSRQFAAFFSRKPKQTYSEGQLSTIKNQIGMLRNRGWTEDADEFTSSLTGEPMSGGLRIEKDMVLGVFGDAVITTQHFRALTPMEARRAIKDGLRKIDVEVFSQCNRRCHYCSNSEIDRFTSNQFMRDEVFDQVVGDLGSIDWDGEIRFVGLNEPTMHREALISRTRQARKAVPRAMLTLLTNGDYLTRDYLEEIYDAGIRQMYISVHLQRFMPFDDHKVLKRIAMLCERLGVEYRIDRHVPGSEVYGTLSFRDMAITIFQLDYQRLGHDRGGLLEGIGRQDYVRTAACIVPVQMMVVSFNGNVLPCCHFVGDAEKHQHLVVGKLGHGQSLFDIYASPEYQSWRSSLFTIGPKGKECRNCIDYADSTVMQSDQVADAITAPKQSSGIEVFGATDLTAPVEGIFRVKN